VIEWGTTRGDDRPCFCGALLMSQPESSSYRGDAAEAEDAAALADQMKAATSSLRARLSLVPDVAETPGEVSGADV
jgi:hypothetical protein